MNWLTHKLSARMAAAWRIRGSRSLRHGAGRRQEPRLAVGARVGPFLVGQPGDERDVERFLAERGLHGVCRTPHSRGGLRPRARRNGGGARRRELDEEIASCRKPTAFCTSISPAAIPTRGCTLVPYEKGALLLLTIEQEVGRERFDRFLRSYFDHFAFQSIETSGLFGVYSRGNCRLPCPSTSGFTVPESRPAPTSSGRISSTVRGRWEGQWTTHEWLHFLRAQRVAGYGGRSIANST